MKFKMKLKTQKILKISAISLLSTSVVVGTCFATNEKYHWVDSLNNYFDVNDGNLEDEDVTIISKGIKVKPVASIVNSDGYATKVFTYQVQPSDATIKDVNVSVAYHDGTDCSQVIEVFNDQEKNQVTVKCKQDFSKQVVVTLTSAEWPDVSAEVKIDYLEKVTGVVANTETLYYDKIISSEMPLDLFTWTSSKYTIAKKDYTFTISGGDVSNVGISELIYNLNTDAGRAFADKFARLTKDALLTETLVNNVENSQKVRYSTESNMPSARAVWDLTNDTFVHHQLSLYSENSRDQEVQDSWYITYDVTNLVATCSNGEKFNFNLKVAAGLNYNFSSCYTRATGIDTNLPSLVF